MIEFDDLKNIWSSQKAPVLPDVAEIIKKASAEKRSMENKILFQVFCLFAAIVGVGVVVFVIDFKMVTTYIGIILMFIAVFVFSILRLRQAMQLRNLKLTDPPIEVLSTLEKFYRFQQILNTKGTLAYFIILNAAFAFYFIEVLQPLSATIKSIVLLVYVAWMLLAYFVIGKKQIAKEHQKTESMINAIRQLEQEYKAED